MGSGSDSGLLWALGGAVGKYVVGEAVGEDGEPEIGEAVATAVGAARTGILGEAVVGWSVGGLAGRCGR